MIDCTPLDNLQTTCKREKKIFLKLLNHINNIQIIKKYKLHHILMQKSLLRMLEQKLLNGAWPGTLAKALLPRAETN